MLLKVIIKVKSGSAYASKNGYTFKANMDHTGFDVKEINDEFPNSTVGFSHKEALIVNLDKVKAFWDDEESECMLKKYCKANKIKF